MAKTPCRPILLSNTTTTTLPARPSSSSSPSACPSPAALYASRIAPARRWPLQPEPTQSRAAALMATVTTTQGAVVAARAATSHGKLHKRVRSSNSPHAPPLHDGSATSALHAGAPSSKEARTEAYRASPGTSKSKAYLENLKKLSSRDTNTIDLSRSAAENETLTGLGILNYGPGSKSATDVAFSSISGRASHNCSISLNSQYSATSNSYRPAMWSTMRPYTPPTFQDHASNVGSQYSADAIDIPEEDPPPLVCSSTSIKFTNAAPKLLVATGTISTQQPSPFQGSAFTPPTSVHRSRRDTMRSARSVDTSNTASPSSRTSLDRAFSIIRIKETDSQHDPTARAASIRAARRAFVEREEAKNKKAEHEELKAREKQSRKLERREDRQRERSEASQRRRREKPPLLDTEKVDNEGFQPGRSYEELKPDTSVTIGGKTGFGGRRGGEARNRATPGLSKNKRGRSRYLRFLTWLKTRLLKLGRKLS